MENNQNDLLTRTQVMQLLKVSGVTLSKYTTTGRLSFFRVGRRILFDRQQILSEIKHPKTV